MKEILIVVDMQEGFSKLEEIRKLVVKIKELLTMRLFDVVIATKFANNDGSMFETLLSWTDMKDEADQRICAEIVPYIDITMKKQCYSAVNDELLRVLKENNNGYLPERVFLVGMDTDCCVLSTAISLFEVNIRPIVLEEYTGSTGGAEAHWAGLQCLRRIIGNRQICSKRGLNKESLEEI